MGKPRMPKPRPTIIDPDLDRVLNDLLIEKVPVGADLYDFVTRWLEAPAEESDREQPWDRTRPELELRFIRLAETQPQANEALRSLLRYLEENGEPASTILSTWVMHRGVWGDPAPRRGRPPDVNEATAILKPYWLLRDLGRTPEEAMSTIATKLNAPYETIRSTVRKYGKTHPIPVEIRPIISP